MKRKTREVNVFSMSALDLFASALGAFILLAINLHAVFPQYWRSSENLRGTSQKIIEDGAGTGFGKVEKQGHTGRTR